MNIKAHIVYSGQIHKHYNDYDEHPRLTQIRAAKSELLYSIMNKYNWYMFSAIINRLYSAAYRNQQTEPSTSILLLPFQKSRVSIR